MKHYLEELKQVFGAVQSSEKGLTAEEAKKRLAENGPNKLDEPEKDSIIKQFFAQMKDPMIIVLLAAAVISAVTSVISTGHLEADVFIILFVVIANAVLGVYQESKAEKAIEALQEMTSAMSKVIRDGKLTLVKSEELVVGDVVVLEAGDSIPADMRLFESASLKIEEAALTGESVPVTKYIDMLYLEGKAADIPLGDRKNMTYMGSSVAYGRGHGVVIATGMQTEMGKIATAISEAEDGETPLQKKLSQLSVILSKVVLLICIGIFALKVAEDYLHGATVNFSTVLDSFLIAVSLAVAAIPEGLAAVVTIVLSIGVTNMSHRNAVIRKLTAVETLGCAQIICSDKTGTLTQNKMTVVDASTADSKLLATIVTMCSDAAPDDTGAVFGEPTEVALVNFGIKEGLDKRLMEAETPRCGEAPFDSNRKMMSTVHRAAGGYIQYTKGAPDMVLKKCTKILDGGRVRPITDADRADIAAENKRMADNALRCILGAYRDYAEEPASYEADALEQDLTYVGITGMIDPVRPEVKDAIVECNRAGIRPIMITGDHRDTAVAIAKELGIIKDESGAITGAQLSEMSDEEFEANVGRYSVYARVQPEHKVRIVNAWRKKGCIVAMTGDGVNDAPSIKTADIGVGMGITGTDVTKNVADMVLADDNFATIVSAIEEGRRIYDNIRKAVQFLLSSNLSEVLCILIATLGLGAITGGPFTILLPVHLLWINLVTDCFPAIALGMEKAEADIMERAPRSASDGIFSGGLAIDLLYQGITVAVLTVISYCIGANAGVDAVGIHETGVTMAFLTMSMCEIFHSFNMRSQRGSIFKMKYHNGMLYGAMIASLILTAIVIFVPFLRVAFSLHILDAVHYFEGLGLAFAIIPIVETVKFFQRRAAAKKQRA